ncbi:MAG: hypothetical protein R3E79_37990 [Caldilineaceae bacterium]
MNSTPLISWPILPCPTAPTLTIGKPSKTESLRRSLRAALEKIAWAQAATVGNAEQAITTARRQLALDPLDEKRPSHPDVLRPPGPRRPAPI